MIKPSIKKYLLLNLLFLFLISLANSCSSSSCRSIAAGSLLGSWRFDIDEDLFKGIDVIALNANGELVEMKSFTFSSTDNDFSFSIKGKVDIGGNWSLKSDSLFISYDNESLKIECDTTTFYINTNRTNSNIKIAPDIKIGMLKDLCSFMDSYIKYNYDNLPKQIAIGKIEEINMNSIIISNNKNQIELIRE